MRKPFKKQINSIKTEDAHGGSGSRQLILSKDDPISTQLDAMTKGIIPVNGFYDWHQHDDIDEFFLVVQGNGTIEFEDGTKIEYIRDDLVYIPANIKHRINNSCNIENIFYFIRLKQ